MRYSREHAPKCTTGPLNQGTYSVKSWTGYGGLLYTTSNAGNSPVRGFNLVGNPYPSSIDWSTFSSSVVYSAGQASGWMSPSGDGGRRSPISGRSRVLRR